MDSLAGAQTLSPELCGFPPTQRSVRRDHWRPCERNRWEARFSAVDGIATELHILEGMGPLIPPFRALVFYRIASHRLFASSSSSSCVLLPQASAGYRCHRRRSLPVVVCIRPLYSFPLSSLLLSNIDSAVLV